MKITGGRSYFVTQAAENTVEFKEVARIDRLAIDASSLTAKELRSVMALALQQPYGSLRLLYIRQSDQLTDILQNMLLKLVEEPPPYLTIVLELRHPDRLLPTMQSRLHRLTLHTGRSDSLPKELPQGFLSNESQTKRVLSELRSRDEAVELLEGGLELWKETALNQPSALTTHNLRLLETTLQKLKLNTNQKLTLDALLLNWIFR